MIPTTLVNKLTVVHLFSDGTAISGPPDVCKSPSIPIPYVNVAFSRDLILGSTTVKVDGSPIALKDSLFSTSYGDEPGVGGGIISGVNKGTAKFINYSMDVFVEGRNVCRLTDPMLMNGNTDNTANPAEVQGNRLSADTKPCENTKLKPISQAKARALFKKMVAAGDNITFDYPADCCYSRAHAMCHMMKDKGVECGKVWNYQSPTGPPLTVSTRNSPSGQVTWRYHVAPIVAVKGADGKVRTMVIDPSMFDKPVTIDQWKAAQHSQGSITQCTDSSPYYRGANGVGAQSDNDLSETKRQIDKHRVKRDNPMNNLNDPDFTKKLKNRREKRVRDAKSTGAKRKSGRRNKR